MKKAIILILIIKLCLFLGVTVYGGTNSFSTSKQTTRKTKKTRNGKLAKVLKLAVYLVGKRYKRFHHQKRSFSGDCSGFIRFIFSTQGKKLIDPVLKLRRNNGAYAIYYSMNYQSAVHHRKIPAIGDLVFFNESYDRNRDGKVNDLYTHVGIVEKIDLNGTISFIHYVNRKRGIRRDKLNLNKPNNVKKNSYLRDRRRYPNPNGQYLTGQLFAGFATVRFL